MLTVLTRTSNRPNFFRRCRQSVLEQTSRAYHIVSLDDPRDTYAHGDVLVKVCRDTTVGARPENAYFNVMRRRVPPSFPYVMFLDDDDQFASPEAVATICRYLTTNRLVLWRVGFGNEHTIPEDNYWGGPPQPGHISGIGFAFNVQHWHDWKPEHFGDYHVVRHLYQHLSPVWLPSVLTRIQISQGMGQRDDRVY